MCWYLQIFSLACLSCKWNQEQKVIGSLKITHQEQKVIGCLKIKLILLSTFSLFIWYLPFRGHGHLRLLRYNWFRQRNTCGHLRLSWNRLRRQRNTCDKKGNVTIWGETPLICFIPSVAWQMMVWTSAACLAEWVDTYTLLWHCLLWHIRLATDDMVPLSNFAVAHEPNFLMVVGVGSLPIPSSLPNWSK